MSNLKKEETCQNGEKEVTEQTVALTNEKSTSESIPKKKVTKKVSFLLDEDGANAKKEDVKMDGGSLEGHQNGDVYHAGTDEGKHSNGQHSNGQKRDDEQRDDQQRDDQKRDGQKSDCKENDRKENDFVKISWAKCSSDGERNGDECWGKEKDNPNGSSCNENEHKLFSSEDNQRRRFHTQFKFFAAQETQHKMFAPQENQHKLFASRSKENEYKDKEKEPSYVKFDKRECAKNEQNSMFLKDQLEGGETDEMAANKKNGEGGEKAETKIKTEAKIEVKTERTDFEKSYNESLNNFRASSFVDILNSMQVAGKGGNGGPNGEAPIGLIPNENIPNGNAPHDYRPSANGKDYENVDYAENQQNDNIQLIACILCGDSIKANASKMCNNCILQNVESSSVNINKDTYLIYYCRECKRYLHNRWVYCELESKELLALCLKKVNKLKKLKILDAKFLYTEPHSKRIKIHLSVQEELINNFISEMELILHYVIKYTQCDDCKKTYTPYTYNTCVSVRQKVEHKKTLLFLESLLLKYNMNENIINIVSNPDGLDFHFLSRTDALKFCDFILSKTMSKCKNSKHLINHDANNNTYNYLYSFSIDICPICKYDLIFFPKDLSIKYGIKSSFYLCLHVSIFIILINPFCSSNSAHISQERYNKHPFLPLLSKADSKVFLILNVEYIDNDPYSKNERRGGAFSTSAAPSNDRCYDSIGDTAQEDDASLNGRQKGASNRSIRAKDKNVNLKRKTKNSISSNTVEEVSSDDLFQVNEENGSIADSKSCKSSSRKVKLDKLVYAFVELYDESEGNTILTKTCNARHLKPGDYVNAYDLRKHTFDNDISLYLEKEDNYSIIIIDKVKPKERQKIENELQVQNNNIETMKNMNDDDIFKSILLNNCAGMENMTIR